MESRIFELCRKASRVSITKEKDKAVEKASTFSVAKFEEEQAAARLQLSQAADRDVSISYSNPNQLQMAPTGNFQERSNLTSSIASAASYLAGRRAYLYQWILDKYYELKFSQQAYDIFASTQSDLVTLMAARLPSETQKIASMLDDLASDNPEKWANAAHSCRRLMQEVADAVFPARDDIEKTVGEKTKKIKLGKENYINRLVCFDEEKLDSISGQRIIGTSLEFLGNRLDALLAGAQKGSHAKVTREEAERIFINTALIVTDVLRLSRPNA